MGPQMLTVAEAAMLVPDGVSVAMTGFAPMALVRALIRRGARDLHLVTVPSGGLAVDMLIGAGCVRSLETSEVGLGESGFAQHFSRTVKERAVGIQDST
jgi:glutaconate CoA-transferase, subunit A